MLLFWNRKMLIMFSFSFFLNCVLLVDVCTITEHHVLERAFYYQTFLQYHTYTLV